MSAKPSPVVIWQFLDGKPGHENQSAGLLQALGELLALEVHALRCEGRLAALGHWLMGRYPSAAGLPTPRLIVGAGHATHLPMLAARRARGGRVVVLMKPSLPCRWFDLCLVPRHDEPPVAGNILPTRGVLNRILPGGAQDVARGLILVGGPSRHHAWQDADIAADILQLVAHEREVHWRLTTSRRTPASFLAVLQAMPGFADAWLELVPWEQTGRDWLPQQLQQAGRVWVTADSVSMVYEALTSGAAVGVLPVLQRHAGRVSRGLEQMLQEKRLITLKDRLGGEAYPQPQPFNEARRCALWIRDQWLSER